MITKATPAYQLDVCIKGKPVTQYNAPSKIDDIWVEGRAGSDYTIRLRNNTGQRAKFVVSVDGLSINDGKVAGISSPGYILDGFETLDIPGWLASGTKAAKFVFGSKQASYAESMGEGSNTGVIGLLVFTEKYKPTVVTNNHLKSWDYWGAVDQTALQPYYLNQCVNHLTIGSATCAVAPREQTKSAERRITTHTIPLNTAVASSYTAAPEPSLGTEFGESVDFKTQKVEFEQSSTNPSYTSIVYYDDAKGLNRIGIVLDWQRTQTTRPNPFPADPNYCKKPAGWS